MTIIDGLQLGTCGRHGPVMRRSAATRKFGCYRRIAHIDQSIPFMLDLWCAPSFQGSPN